MDGSSVDGRLGVQQLAARPEGRVLAISLATGCWGLRRGQSASYGAEAATSCTRPDSSSGLGWR